MEKELFDDGKLITMVEEYPCLYDRGDQHYKNRAVVEKIWLMIAGKLNVPADFCIQRWGNIRNRYGKERRKNRVLSATDGGAHPMWEHYELCAFLDDIIIPRRTKHNIMNEMKLHRKDVDPLLPLPIKVKVEPMSSDDLIAETSCSSVNANITSYSKGKTDVISERNTTPSSFTDRSLSTPSPGSETPQRKKMKTEDQSMKASSTMNQSGDGLSDCKDEDVLFGESIGLTLKKITSLKRKLTAKAKLMSVLSEYVDSD